jgi:hypothetical protein
MPTTNSNIGRLPCETTSPSIWQVFKLSVLRQIERVDSHLPYNTREQETLREILNESHKLTQVFQQRETSSIDTVSQYLFFYRIATVVTMARDKNTSDTQMTGGNSGAIEACNNLMIRIQTHPGMHIAIEPKVHDEAIQPAVTTAGESAFQKPSIKDKTKPSKAST